MTYLRVIPRDLFNEGNLLKCFGQLYLGLEALRMENCLVQHTDTEFDVAQSEDDGSLTLENVQLEIRGTSYYLHRPMNSRRPYPLWVRTGDDDVEVFRDDGSFTPEMLAFLRRD